MCLILASCQSDEECSLAEKCLQGQCNNPCDEQSACGMNAECRVISHNKQCSCPPGFTGNHDVECVRSKFSVFSTELHSICTFPFKLFITCSHILNHL
jgi:hypothetical protein